MSECASCSAQLRPEWKFCIYCGAPAIPGAIRPEVLARPRPSRGVIIALVLAGVWFAVGIALLVSWLNGRP